MSDPDVLSLFLRFRELHEKRSTLHEMIDELHLDLARIDDELAEIEATARELQTPSSAPRQEGPARGRQRGEPKSAPEPSPSRRVGELVLETLERSPGQTHTAKTIAALIDRPQQAVSDALFYLWKKGKAQRVGAGQYACK